MLKPLTKKEAFKYLSLDEKTFDNYFKNAYEFPCIKRKSPRARFYFDEEVLREWKKGFDWRVVELTKEDYALCLDFALAMHFRSYVRSDFGTGRQREFGQKITNWMKGQLGEVAVKKFLKREFDIDIELDFEIRKKIVPQDIIGIVERGVMRTPKIGVGIKSSKPKSAYLILGENEVEIEGRRSDIHIFCRPDIPDDHFLRLAKSEVMKMVKNGQHYSKYVNLIPSFTNIPCEIAGWCNAKELEHVGEIPGQVFSNGMRWVKKSGLLKKTKKDWDFLVKRL